MLGHNGKSEFLLCKLKINGLYHLSCPNAPKIFSWKMGGNDPVRMMRGFYWRGSQRIAPVSIRLGMFATGIITLKKYENLLLL
jgi:hypothetical protein